MAMMYCPELNSEELSKDNGKAVLDLIDQCTKYTENIDTLDSFVTKVAMQMKAKNIVSRKTLITIIYSRHWVFELFVINLMFEVLKLGEEQQEKVLTKNLLCNRYLYF